MIKHFKYILLIAALYLCIHLNAQELHGIILERNGTTPIGYASIKINNKNAAVADSTGNFRIKTQPGNITVSISKVGYATLFQTVRMSEDDRVTINFYLDRYANELQNVVISSSKVEKEIAREAVSIVSIQPSLIASTNSNTLSDVLNRVPGISVVDGQAIMRGGVGWSYNVGSRVMVLLDDMPLMGPDAGDVMWDLLPIEAAENIEVMKGPASVLYGSSASNGTISVRTGWPSRKPETKIQFYQGITGYPKDRYKAWWDLSSQPFNTGTFFSHKQRFGKWDMVLSGNIDANRSYIQQNDNYRARAYLKTRYRFKNIPGLTAGINGTMMFKKGGRFFLWKDGDSSNLIPFDGSMATDLYRIWSIDPHVTYSKPGNYTLSVKLRHYQITRFAETQDTVILHRTNDAIANTQALDINFQKTWFQNFSTTSGIYLTRMWAVGNVYPGKFTGYSAAAFTQAEYIYKKNLTLTAGLRYEVNAMGPIEQSPGPLFRAGVNYKSGKKTFLRATYGEGFRFPTVTERYIEDQLTSFAVLSNPTLKNEFGWYTELGAKQGFKIGEFNATLDAALFWQEYKNLIQFQFNQWKNDSFYIDFSSGAPVFVPIHGIIGFKSINMGHTRTAGFELTLEGSGNIGAFGLRTLSGYTMVYPVDLDADPSLKPFFSYVKEALNTSDQLSTKQYNSLLSYRNRKLIKSDIELSYHKLTLGYGLFYYSIFEKIDGPLYTLVPGIDNFLKKSAPGDWVHNIRFGYAVNQQVTIAFLVNNMFNHEYAIRLARIEPPRNFNLQIRLRI